MRRLAIVAIACGSCDKSERAAPPRARLDIDTCSIVTQNDAAALFGKPAIQKPSAPGECVWSCDCELSEGSSWSLRVHAERAAKPGEPAIVTRTEITFNGRPVTDPSIVVAVPIDETAVLALELTSHGPSAPAVDTKTAALRQLAQTIAARNAR